MSILDSKLNISIRDIIYIATIVFSAAGLYYSLKSEIEEAKVNPKPGTGAYVIDYSDETAKATWAPTRQEYDMKYEVLAGRVTKIEALLERAGQ